VCVYVLPIRASIYFCAPRSRLRIVRMIGCEGCANPGLPARCIFQPMLNMHVCMVHNAHVPAHTTYNAVHEQCASVPNTNGKDVIHTRWADKGNLTETATFFTLSPFCLHPASLASSTRRSSLRTSARRLLCCNVWVCFGFSRENKGLGSS